MLLNVLQCTEQPLNKELSGAKVLRFDIIAMQFAVGMDITLYGGRLAWNPL